MKRLFILFLSLISFSAYAQDYLLELNNGDKIIHIEQLKLPSTASVEDVIYLFPELFGRPNYEVLNTYNIEVDGFSVGSASKDFVLSNIHAYSIQKITISDSPANSYDNNGQGGTIKIALKDATPGYSGNADISGNSSWNVTPSAQLNFMNEKGNFKMHTFAAGQVYQTASDYVRLHMEPISPSVYNEFTDTSRAKFDSQLLRTYMKYSPNSKNRFEFVVSLDRMSNNLWNREQTYRPVTDTDVKYNADANTKYILTTDEKGSEFTAEVKLGYHPASKYQDIPNFRSRQTEGGSWSAIGKVEYKPVFNNILTMFFGSEYNYTGGVSDFSESAHYFGPQGPINYSTTTASLYLNPYVKAQVKAGQWSLQGKIDYQFYNFEVSATNFSENFSNVRHDYAASVFANWQFKDNQALRFSYEKKVRRPSTYQMTPNWSFDTNTYNYIVGNNNLIPMKVRDLGVEYITDFRTPGSLFTFNVGLDFIYVTDIIRSVTVEAKPSMGIDKYLTFKNSGSAGIVNGNLFLYYRSGILSVSAAANVFFNNDYYEGKYTNHTYYNLSLQPTLSFPSDWVVMARAMWYSDVMTQTSNLGGFSVAYLDIAKTWGHFTVDLIGQVPFPRSILNSSIDESGLVTLLSSRSAIPYIGLEFSYRF